LATDPRDEFRDGAQAVIDAERACKLTGDRSWGYLDTLAAAYAEAGSFDQAIETSQKVLQLAPDQYHDELSERLLLFQTDQPFRQPSDSSDDQQDAPSTARVGQ
jgi:tetratricopeptide (TPR) repeat protein